MKHTMSFDGFRISWMVLAACALALAACEGDSDKNSSAIPAGSVQTTPDPATTSTPGLSEAAPSTIESAAAATRASKEKVTPNAAAAGMSIKISGKHFLDADGNILQLRGVNIAGLEFVAVSGWSASNPWGMQTGDPTPNWTTVKTWGTNAVRLPLNEASWLGLSCLDVGGSAGKPGAIIKADPGGNYQATVEQSVREATAAGLYVILDLHWGAPNQGTTPVCPTTQNPMADLDHSIAFWTSLATRFKSNPAVIFELFNEPFLDARGITDDSWHDLLNGGKVNKLAYGDGHASLSMDLTWSTAGMQQMLDAVRAAGATNVVLISTLQWGSQMDGWLKYKPSDPIGQLGAVWHAYPASPTQVGCVADNIISVGFPACSALEMSAVQAILAAGYPVAITEYGDAIGGTSAPWASVLLPFADANGISYFAWTWDKWTVSKDNLLITDAAGTPTAGYGTYVKQHYLCRAAGTVNCR